VWAAVFAVVAPAQTLEIGHVGFACLTDCVQTVESADFSVRPSLINDVPARFSRLELEAPPKHSTQILDTHASFSWSVTQTSTKVEPTDPTVALNIPNKPRSPFDGFEFKPELDEPAGDDPPAKMPSENKFHWRAAINQSLMMIGIQHGYALIAQEKTRKAVANGKFFSDYWNSVKSIEGWDDGNRFATNYIAHPMQGGLTGFIFVQNHDRAKAQKFGESKQYWKDRFTAFVWSTAWSTQFELGPISQSSIGNVGLSGHMGYVDLVITPTVGTAWLITEEAIDRYVIRHIESRSMMMKALARMFLNPMRTVANLLRFREPWFRDRPFGH
jgi:hypothetical protein